MLEDFANPYESDLAEWRAAMERWAAEQKEEVA